MSLRTALLAPIFVALLAGCGPNLRLATPEGFATLEDDNDYVYRATSAAGVVIGVRREANKPKANLDFWSEALDRALRRRGYEPEGPSTEVRATGGQPGRQMRYTKAESGRTYRFWVTVFVTDSKVFVVEAGGDKDRFKGDAEESVKRAIASITIG